MRRLLNLFLAAGFVFAPARTTEAGCRHVKVVAVQQQAIVAYQPVAQPYYWSVGTSLQEDAQAQRIAAKVMQLLQGQAQQLTAPAQSCQDGTCPTPQQLVSPEVDRWALVKASCASCHTTNVDAMAAVDMTDLSALSCETKLKMAAAVLDGIMPPKKSLDPSVTGNLLGEIVGAATVGK